MPAAGRQTEHNVIHPLGGQKKVSVGAHLEAELTDYLIVGKAHDVHGVQSLLEVLLVLLARDGNVTV